MFEYSFSNSHQILTGTRILNFKIIQILSVGCRLFKILRSQFSRKTKIILFIFVRGINLYLSNILCLINSFFFFFSFRSKSMPVPWRFILTSWPAWSIGITTFGRIWVHYIFIISGPMYMKTVLGFSIQAVHA